MSEQRPAGEPRTPTDSPYELAFDAERILLSVDGDRQLLREIAVLFFEDAPKLLDQMTHAVSERDGKGLWSSAHALKGAVSNFAANAAFESARELEVMGRQADFRSAEAARDRLVRELARLKTDLTAFLGGDLTQE